MKSRIACIVIATAVFFTAMNTGCKKTKLLNTGGVITFSADTLTFDTVFTAEGSFTLNLLIYNPQDEEINLSSVGLYHGAASYFHLNVDGFPDTGKSVQNLKIAAHDSLYVFATVDINPNNTTTPFLITDSLVATLNGKSFYVRFQAYGQNARYIVDSILPTQTWDTKLPYVIINSAEVDSGATLTINPGCRVYMHENSGLIVLGKLIINGTANDTVIFQGDRLDRAYFGGLGYPGEWGGIYFDSHSNGSRLSYTRFENCGNAALGSFPAAIQVGPDSINYNSPYNIPSGTPQLSLDHCIVENSLGYGLLSFQGTVVATDCLIDDCGSQALAIIQGGYDSLINCTFACYSTYALTHNEPTVAILNYYEVAIGDYDSGSLNAVLRNCIVWGSLDSETFCDALPGVTANLRLDHCLLSIGNSIESFVTTTSCILNQDPLFDTVTSADFRLQSTSPAIGTGITVPGQVYDLDGYPWKSPPDIGCYQYH